MNSGEIVPMEISTLNFDVRNPRLVEFDLTDKSTEAEIMRCLWDAMDVKELVMSIAASGFFRHEPLIVAHEAGKNVVIEGNRRLAAVKLLIDDTLAEDLDVNIPLIDSDIREDIKVLPTISSTREDAWRYLGFKHVNGPAKWSSYAKARYIANIHRDFGVPLPEIAEQIGDTHRTVQRLFRGLMVIEEAEQLGVFTREDAFSRRFPFSHLYASLERPNISAFLGLRAESEESKEPVPQEKQGELRQLCLWLYGSKTDNIPPAVRRQNPHVRYLDAIVGSREAIAALRINGDIEAAHIMTRPSSSVFEEAVVAAKQKLQEAHSMLSNGYDGSEELLRTAGTVANLADDLYEQMERKHHPDRRNRRVTEAA